MLVFNGQADIRDFPEIIPSIVTGRKKSPAGKRRKKKEASKPQEDKTAKVRLNEKRRMSLKRKRSLNSWSRKLLHWRTKRKPLKLPLCSGTVSVEELTEKSKRCP